MSALSARWAHWTDRFAALSRRERIIVAGALIFGGGFLIFNFGVDPFLQKARSASRAEAAARAELAQQHILMASLQGPGADPDALNRKRLVQLRQEWAAVSERLARLEAGMVPPTRMQAFLEGILAKNSGVQVLGFKTLPVTQVGIGPGEEKPDTATNSGKGKPGAPAAIEGIYQHGIEITLAGNYNDLLNYLTDLERLPQHVMWNSVSLAAGKYPRNTLVLRIYTLSLSRNWLIV